MDIEELAAGLRPPAGLDDPSSREQSVEAGVSVGVQNPGEGLEVSPRMLALAIGRVEEQCRRRPDAAKRPPVTNVSPQASRLGLAAARRQYRHRRVVAKEGLRGHHLGGEYFVQRRQSCGGG